ncbi:hypothetical protein SNEBB_008680 [Seison nebaliae]|nr:hypothetical protein SNEBB_008680 [Seison nebaliae]
MSNRENRMRSPVKTFVDQRPYSRYPDNVPERYVSQNRSMYTTSNYDRYSQYPPRDRRVRDSPEDSRRYQANRRVRSPMSPEPRPRNKLFIGDLDSSTTKHDLDYIFRDYGEIEEVFVSHQPPGWGFVEFRSISNAIQAYEACQGKAKIGGRLIHIDYAYNRRPKHMPSYDTKRSVPESDRSSRDTRRLPRDPRPDSRSYISKPKDPRSAHGSSRMAPDHRYREHDYDKYMGNNYHNSHYKETYHRDMYPPRRNDSAYHLPQSSSSSSRRNYHYDDRRGKRHRPYIPPNVEPKEIDPGFDRKTSYNNNGDKSDGKHLELDANKELDQDVGKLKKNEFIEGQKDEEVQQSEPNEGHNNNNNNNVEEEKNTVNNNELTYEECNHELLISASPLK